MKRKKLISILIFSHLVVIILSFFGAIHVINIADKLNDADDAFVCLVETHLLLDGKYEDLLNVKDIQIGSYVLEGRFDHSSQKRRLILAEYVRDYYSKTNQKLPVGSKDWFEKK